ncbi:MAG: hypothetical protein NTV88_02690, partial [Candidatus Micrarchaeota archaeon]|nr:hypothetical protein [Candidatus Micrarchaeota archaeon]
MQKTKVLRVLDVASDGSKTERIYLNLLSSKKFENVIVKAFADKICEDEKRLPNAVMIKQKAIFPNCLEKEPDNFYDHVHFHGFDDRRGRDKKIETIGKFNKIMSGDCNFDNVSAEDFEEMNNVALAMFGGYEAKLAYITEQKTEKYEYVRALQDIRRIMKNGGYFFFSIGDSCQLLSQEDGKRSAVRVTYDFVSAEFTHVLSLYSQHEQSMGGLLLSPASEDYKVRDN